jgi:hypothetical protein
MLTLLIRFVQCSPVNHFFKPLSQLEEGGVSAGRLIGNKLFALKTLLDRSRLGDETLMVFNCAEVKSS